MRLYDRFFDPEKSSRAYQQEEEYWRDWFALLDMRIYILLAYRLQKPEEPERLHLKASVLRGLSLSAEEAAAVLAAESYGAGQTADEAVRDAIVLAQAHIMGRLAYTPQGGRNFQVEMLVRMFGLSKLEQFLLFLSMAVPYDARYEALFVCLQGEGCRLPSLRLAFALYELTDPVLPAEQGQLLQLGGKLFRYLVDGDRGHSGPPGSRMFLIAGRVFNYLLGCRLPPPELACFVTADQSEEMTEAYIRKDLLMSISRLFARYAKRTDGGCHIIHIYGEKGIGKRFSIRQAARENGFQILFVKVARIIDSKIPEMDLAVRALKRECILTHSILCLEAPDDEPAEHEFQQKPFPPELDYFLEILAQEFPFFVWTAEQKAGYLNRYPLHSTAIELPLLTVGERVILWRQFSADYDLAENIDIALFANQFILTARGIREVLIRAGMMAAGAGREQIQTAELLAAVKQQSVNQLGKYAVLINAVFTWEDLIISAEQKRQMQMICDQVRYRNVVGEEWGFHRKTPYGQGICALFYGSPGTGKTMAVQVMANQLGMDLYRIDLSQMVSKYIGETEKNISDLFHKAKNINAMLFFDEADSLFAKRSEVKDANDRYANSSTSHLLQKLEDYSGITILATNYVNNIDDAFKRRIKFMVNFVFPTEAVRYQLWTTIIPKQVVYEEEIDFEFFARNFELSGSNIKEILTNAAYLAAAEHRGLANGDIVEAIKLNFAKYGKMLTADDFGYLV